MTAGWREYAVTASSRSARLYRHAIAVSPAPTFNGYANSIRARPIIAWGRFRDRPPTISCTGSLMADILDQHGISISQAGSHDRFPAGNSDRRPSLMCPLRPYAKCVSIGRSGGEHGLLFAVMTVVQENVYFSRKTAPVSVSAQRRIARGIRLTMQNDALEG